VALSGENDERRRWAGEELEEALMEFKNLERASSRSVRDNEPTNMLSAK
jgi:hypothetical protein